MWPTFWVTLLTLCVARDGAEFAKAEAEAGCDPMMEKCLAFRRLMGKKPTIPPSRLPKAAKPLCGVGTWKVNLRCASCDVCYFLRVVVKNGWRGTTRNEHERERKIRKKRNKIEQKKYVLYSTRRDGAVVASPRLAPSSVLYRSSPSSTLKPS